MRILTKTSLYCLIVSVVVFLLGGLSFYKILQTEISDEVDDQLFTDKENIIEYIRRHNELPSVTSGISEAILVKELSDGVKVIEALSDTLIYSAYDEEFIPFQKTIVHSLPRRKAISVYHPQIPDGLRGTLFESTMLAMAWIFLLLLIGLAGVNYFVNKYTWLNFYDTLHRAKRYSLTQREPLYLSPTKTREFRELDRIMQAMTKKIHNDYINI